MAVAALWTAEATSICLALQAVQAGLAEVVATWKQVGVPVQVQAHRTGELLLQDATLIRQGRGHDAFLECDLREMSYMENGWEGVDWDDKRQKIQSETC